MTYAKDSFTFRGRYADIVKSLCTPQDNRQIFSTYYQAYVFGALYGVLNGYNVSLDTNCGEGEATIRADAMNHSLGIESYPLIRKLVILYESKRKLPFSERLDYCLRFDNIVDESTPEVIRKSSKYDENTVLLNEYVLGGLSAFYEKISERKSREDIIIYMNEVIENFNKITTSEEGSESIDLVYNP